MTARSSHGLHGQPTWKLSNSSDTHTHAASYTSSQPASDPLARSPGLQASSLNKRHRQGEIVEQEILHLAQVMFLLQNNVERVIVGKRAVVELAMVALLCEGHILIEDVPGTGKTMLARAISKSLGCSFRRVQSTPDLLPSDLTGTYIFNQRTSDFEFRPGPLFAQVVLADEINRATPRTQSAPRPLRGRSRAGGPLRCRARAPPVPGKRRARGRSPRGSEGARRRSVAGASRVGSGFHPLPGWVQEAKKRWGQIPVGVDALSGSLGTRHTNHGSLRSAPLRAKRALWRRRAKRAACIGENGLNLKERNFGRWPSQTGISRFWAGPERQPGRGPNPRNSSLVARRYRARPTSPG